MARNGLVPARFLAISAQFVYTIVLYLSMNCNVLSCLPKTRTAAYDGSFGSGCQPPDNLSPHYASFSSHKTELTIALSVSLGLLAFELVGIFGGISTFLPFQGLISTGCHVAGSICIVLYRFDSWCSTDYWFIFGFCCVTPFLTECLAWIGVLGMKKSL